MNPISYSVPDFVERHFFKLMRLNELSIIDLDDGHHFHTLEGKNAFVLEKGSLETFFALPDSEDLRLHASLIASGAIHFGAFSLTHWPRKVLIKQGQIIDDVTFFEMLPGKKTYKCYGVNYAKFYFMGVQCILAVRINSDSEFQSFITFSHLETYSTDISQKWESLCACLMPKGFKVNVIESD